MRKVLAVLFLIVLALFAWFGARWLVHRGEVKVTIVFSQSQGLRRGDPVLENDAVIGKVIDVSPLGDREAITVRVSRDHRRAIVTDSLFSVERRALVVTNTFAVGRPVDSEAILYAREDRLSRWLARHGSAVKPYLDRFRAKADELIDRDFREWTARVPEWKKEGREAFERHLDEVKKQVEQAEEDLRKSDKADEARRLKERFERWLDEVTK